MKRKRVFLTELVCMVLLIIADRVSKIWADTSLQQESDGIDLIPGVLKFYYLPNGNTGAAFGMFKGQIWLFIVMTVLIVCVVLYVLSHLPIEKKYIPLHLTLVFIISGGIGNLIDRIMHGYVVDFIYFYLINFPIFNVADIFVSVSTTILVILLLFCFREEDFKYLESLLVPSYFRRHKD